MENGKTTKSMGLEKNQIAREICMKENGTWERRREKVSSNLETGVFFYFFLVTVFSVIIEGTWKDSLSHGKGKITLADGNTMEGEFIDGKKEDP